MACGRVITGQFRREIRVAVLLEQLHHLSNKAFSFEVGHIAFAVSWLANEWFQFPDTAPNFATTLLDKLPEEIAMPAIIMPVLGMVFDNPLVCQCDGSYEN